MNQGNAIRGLIRACVDDERTLQHESKLVLDPGRAETLTKLAHERKHFLTVLEGLQEGGRRRSSGSWGELVREAARDLWVLACGRNNGDAIAVCRHSRGRTEARYDEALRFPWPAETGRILEEQRRVLHEETQELNQIQF